MDIVLVVIQLHAILAIVPLRISIPVRAQAAYLRGDNKTARDLASRAKTRFAIGTPGWVKADDIVSAKPLPGQKDN